MEMPRRGVEKWTGVKQELRDLCEETLAKIKQRILLRRINLKSVFKDYDR
jgi:hypothetical protein